jgi:hypothetical protein
MRTIDQRFWEKVEKKAYCWEWTGSKYHGYGQFWDGKKLVGASRFSWLLANGVIPPELTIDHVCQNPGCVNPEHLQCIPMLDNCRLGSKAQNTHCPKGHPFEGRNVIWVKTSRMCRICKQDKDRRYHHRNKERINAGKREAWRKACGL